MSRTLFPPVRVTCGSICRASQEQVLSSHRRQSFMKPKRVALYVRVSTGEQNADLQVNELTEYAAFRNCEAVEPSSDKMSGAKDKRPPLDRLMADARRGRFDVVAVWRFDRFARSKIGRAHV